MIKVSVIVPIYQVAAYIERCARSLLEQTLENVELIFVDDCSPDESMQILQTVLAEYPERRVKVRVVRHVGNQGLPAARNTGLALAEGKYIFHFDSDDWAENTLLERLYDAAEEADADFVWCDWYLAFPQNRRLMKQPSFETPREALRGVLAGAMKYNVWNKLVRKELYTQNGILFPAGHAMGEDMTMVRLLACAKRVAYVPEALYNYAKREGEAFTNGWSKQHLDDLFYNTDVTIQFLKERFGEEIEREAAWFQLNAKYSFLISKDYGLYRLWQQHYREAHAHIWTNSYSSFRCKLLQYAAAKHQYWILYLHYQLLYKFIYGVIYK